MNNSIRLILISGNRQMLESHLREQFRDRDVEVIVVDEKAIAKFQLMRTLVRERQFWGTCFGVKEIGVQRYRFFLISYLLLAPSGHKFLVDEQGATLRFNIVRYLSIAIPEFVLEVAVSVVVVVAAFLRLWWLLTFRTPAGTKTRDGHR